MDDSALSGLEAAMARRMIALPHRLRPRSTEAIIEGRAALITGPRGVGKTTFVLSRLKERKVLYVSADSPLVAGRPLYDVAAFAFSRGYEGIACDEVHHARDWSQNLKALYDDYPQHLIWATDSSSLVLRTGVADLSRRFLSLKLPLLSFREYAFLKEGVQLPVLPSVTGDGVDAAALLRSGPILRLFREYRVEGTRPIFLEGSYGDRLLNIIEKTLYADVPFFLPQVTEGNLRLMNAIIGGLARSPVPRLAVRSLCADWGIGAEKLYQIMFVMESVGLLRIIRVENDTKARSVGAKLFFADATIYPALQGNPGTAREALVAALLADSGRIVSASRDERNYDFHDGTLRYEVGGTGKALKSADLVIRDDTDLPTRGTVPLWMLGLLY
jgi:predicted AAA+ superfamily ATPase